MREGGKMAKKNNKRKAGVSSGKNKEGQERQEITFKFIISIVITIIYTMIGIFIGFSINCSGEYYYRLIEFVLVDIFTVFGFMIGAEKYINNNKNAIFILIHLLIFFCGVCFLCAVMKSGRSEDESISMESIANNTKDKSAGINREKNIFQKVVYIMKDDPYFINGIEKYVGKVEDLSEDETVEAIVKILLDNLENNGNKESQDKTEEYDKQMRVANRRYEVYQFQCNLEEKDGIKEEALTQDRLEDLEASIRSRELGDEEHRDCENERLLGTGYRELGDEYQRQKNLTEALKCYKKSGEWFMCAIYLAATTKNYEKMYKCQEGFKALDQEIQKIDKSNNTVKLVNRSVKAYDLFIEKYTSKMK